MKSTESYISGILSTYCEQILCGTKLAAEFGFHKDDQPIVETIIQKNNCRYIIKKRECNRLVVWIYKYNFVATLIQELFIQNHDKISLLTIWASGKLFGYSDFEIASYLQEHGFVEATM